MIIVQLVMRCPSQPLHARPSTALAFAIGEFSNVHMSVKANTIRLSGLLARLFFNITLQINALQHQEKIIITSMSFFEVVEVCTIDGVFAAITISSLIISQCPFPISSVCFCSFCDVMFHDPYHIYSLTNVQRSSLSCSHCFSSAP